MKTFIVPVDFTEGSIKTAVTAAQIASQVKEGRIILYNVYEAISAGVDGTPLANDTGARRKLTSMAFENVKATLLYGHPSLEITYVEEEGSSLVNSLEKFSNEQQADFIVIGVSEGTPMENFLLGINAVDIAKRNVCPVIIIPPNAEYKGVKNVLFASDYKDVESTTPISSIRSVLSLFGSQIHVVHVNNDTNGQQSGDLQQETVKLREMLIEYLPEFHVINDTNFITAIHGLVNEKNIDLILTVPRPHGFFGNLFSAGHIRKLAYQSTVPVIAIHE